MKIELHERGAVMDEQKRIETIKSLGGTSLQYFRTENITYDMCLAAVRISGKAIDHVPEGLRTEEIYLEACKSDGTIIGKVPERFMSQKICECAVGSDAAALELIPEKYLTKELCMKAAINSAEAYRMIPAKYITPEFVAEAARKSSCASVRKLPEAFRENRFYYELICLDPEFLMYIPPDAWTETNCRAAIGAMGCLTAADAVKARPEIFLRFPAALYDHETCLNFVKSELFKEISGGKRIYHIYFDDKKGEGYLYVKGCGTCSLHGMMRWPDTVRPLLALNEKCMICIPEEVKHLMDMI